MSKKRRKGQWQADIFSGFNSGWYIAIDPLGVIIQGIGMARKVDWTTIGGSSFWRKDSFSRWLGKILLPVFMVWFVYTAWPTHWHWVVGLTATTTLLNIIGIWWRKRHPEVEESETFEPVSAEPVSEIRPDEPLEPFSSLIPIAMNDDRYKQEVVCYCKQKEPCDHNYLKFFEEGLGISEQKRADDFRKAVYKATSEKSAESA